MTADEFFWWVVERRYGLTEETVRGTPGLMEAVEREADRRSHEVVERVLAVLRSREGEPPVRPAADTAAAALDPAPGGLPAAGPPLTAGDGLTVAGAARLLGCSPSKVYRLFDAKELRGHKVGDKRVIDPASVEEYKDRHANSRASSPPPPPPRRSGFRHLNLPPRP